MAEIPAEAAQAAAAALLAMDTAPYAHASLVDFLGAAAKVAVEAAAPVLAAHTRAQAVRSIDLSLGSDLVDDAVDAWHDAPRNENGVIALDDHMAFILAAVVPTIATQVRRETAQRIAREISRQKPAGNTRMTWESGLQRAARVARQIGEADA